VVGLVYSLNDFKAVWQIFSRIEYFEDLGCCLVSSGIYYAQCKRSVAVP